MKRCFLIVWVFLNMAFVFAQATSSQIKTPATPGKPVALSFKPGDLHKPLILIAYGDIRFTDPKEHGATDPEIRVALIKQIAKEKPDAILISGDIPWHGDDEKDWQVYDAETQVWHDSNLRVFPALGNHELNGSEARGLENWWARFPALNTARWYSVRLGNCLVLALDTDSKLGEGSPQMVWLKSQLSDLPPDLDFVLFTMHHPPYTNSHDSLAGGHSARSQEQRLGAWLEKQQPGIRAQFLVIAGHVHNYERFNHGGVMYLVAGGGGAKPYLFDRTSDALYQAPKGPTYHYVKLTVDGRTLKASMFKWELIEGGKFMERDSFTLIAPDK